MNVRKDFPILHQKVKGQPLIYFDNAATTQKPKCVLQELENYYSNYNSNVHRGVHHLSQLATQQYELARKDIKSFINAKYDREIVFTKGTTDGINLVANSWGQKNITKGDEILISTMEHHSNIVPWQMLCEKTGAKLTVAPIDDSGQLIFSDLKKMVSSKTKLIAITHISNTLGTINPINEIIELAHQHNSKILIDAAQSVPHLSLDVQKIKCDFLVFSGHKLFGPTGTGVLYVKDDLYNHMDPYQGGGDMIKEVSFKETTYNSPPLKFEAGTPNIAGFIGLKTAIKYVENIGLKNIFNYETKLHNYAFDQMNKIPEIRFVGTAQKKASVISFLIEGSHPFDVGTLLDQMGIAIRTGHHCTQPLMDWFDIPGTARASFSFYNTEEEVDLFIKALKKCVTMLKS
ncbi:MAG: cysteine desulfurase CsdA [Crocinitomicaceae bacterium]|nr:cysteine desulfurase CsdA [Crocinitomicaceae bacterium]|tara:strand:+ start:3015 stop:4223 length:1209 start_codon:yes stop_codon:yes gene_type:complete